jgi:ribosome biogenesis protein NSA1
MELIDVRNGKAIKKYKNFSGTIKSIAINAENDSVASCGLDRFVRVHDINDSKLLNRIYVKSRLNCLLFSKHEPIKPKETKKAEQSIEDKIEDDLVSDINSEDLGTDQLWSDLESVENEHPAVFAKKRAAQKKDNKEDVFKMPKYVSIQFFNFFY